MTKNKQFTNLQLNLTTVYDFLNSALEIDPYLDHLKTIEAKHAVWLGKGQLYGLNKFLQGCLKRNLSPLVGLELQVEISNTIWKIAAFAWNEKSYQTLLKLNFECAKVQPLVWKNHQALFNDLQIIFLLDDQSEKTFLNCQKLVAQQSWNRSQFYLGTKTAISGKWKEFKAYFLPFAPVRYLTTDEQLKYQALQAIKKQILLAEVQKNAHFDYSFKNDTQLKKQFPERYYQINLARFLDNFNLEITHLNRLTSKKFPFPKPTNAKDWLRKVCVKRLKAEFNNDVNYQKRFEYEYKIICEQNWIDYLLIVADYIKFARTKKILVGPGRGSACGSLICYLLNITTIDPIRHQLLFERFLNPNLKQTPDIDTDFEDLRRNDILNYLFTKYGTSHLAQITTYQTIGSRMALRDIGRILGINLSEIDRIAKAVNERLNWTFASAVENSFYLQQQQEKYPLLFRLAKAIINLPRQVGIHAAGLIFVEEKIETVLPCFIDKNGFTITQFDMYDIKDCKLIKMDLLGLKNLTVLHNIVKQIENKTGKTVNLAELPLDDKQTFADLSAGKTLGLFQLESLGMTDLISQIKPDSLDDLAATISLFRPGPLKNRARFLARRFKNEQFTYWIPAFKPILASTHGIPLYQEQILLIVQAFAKFDLATADQLRQIISKKQTDLLPLMRERFYEQAKQAKRTLKLTDDVWMLIEKFVGYGFNRSHAIAYAYISYWMAYLKTHYPATFYHELLNKNLADKLKTANILGQLRQSKALKAITLDLNYSALTYVLNYEAQKLYLPFNLINQIGTTTADRIVAERATNGKFDSLNQFIQRMMAHGMTKKLLKRLILANTFASFKQYNQATLLHNLETIWLYAEVTKTPQKSKQAQLLKTLPQTKIKRFDQNDEELLRNEWESFGFFLNYQLLEKQRKQLAYPQKGYRQLNDVWTLAIDAKNYNQVWLTIVGNIRVLKTKTGTEIAFLTLFDQTGSLEVICFSRLWEKHRLSVQTGSLLVCRLIRSFRMEKLSFICDAIEKVIKGFSND